ncbi:MAG: hypothetical protein FH748_09865 [Balneolaceae bacterium]|nr:hypothetical protein [Balneolaceae bacterium]
MKIKLISSTSFLFFALLIILFPKLLKAQLSPSGKFRNYNAILTSGNQEYLTGRNRLTLDIDAPVSSGTVFISNQILNTYTDSLNSLSYELKEAYVDLYFQSIDLRIGKQVIAHGRADGVFITDILTPLDLSEFLTKPIDLMRSGITSLKATRYFGSNYIELVLAPVFHSNILAETNSRWSLFKQFKDDFSSFYIDSNLSETKKLFQASTHFAFRNNINWNADLFVMYWANGNPAFAKELVVSGFIPTPVIQLHPQYSRRMILAYSGNYIVSENFIVKSESALHLNKPFDYLPQTIINTNLEELTPLQLNQLAQNFQRNTDGFLKKKPWLISMFGAQYKLHGWRLTGQIVNEHIFKYENILLQKQNFSYATLQLQRSFLRDKFQTSVFSRYNFPGNDLWMNPEASYEVSDEIEAGMGLHLFVGKEPDRFYGHFSFHDYKSNSFGYVRITAFF